MGQFDVLWCFTEYGNGINLEKKNFPVKQTLRYSRGCPVADVITDDTPRYALELLDAENKLYDDTLIELTYGKRKEFLKKEPVPEFVSQDKKVLRFYGYYQEDVDDSWGEEFRVHRVKVLYYLDDDKMEIWEPRVPNSGLTQGVLLKKQQVPRPDGRGMYIWKDLNLGIDLIVYGKRIRLTDCDAWTKEYLESAGVLLNPKIDDVPEDSYAKKCREKAMKPKYVSQNIEDEKLWKFLNKDRQVLRFYALWDDTINEPHEKRKVIIMYYLVNDTMEVLEVHSKNSGRDPYPVLIRRQKIPRNLKSVPETFPYSYLEYSDKEIKDWFTPKDLGVDKTVVILQRKMFIYDCDSFTRQYYRQEFDTEMPPAVNVEEAPKKPVAKIIPPHNGLGTWEDSLQSCIYTIPRPPKKDLLKILYNDDKYLRFSAYMDTVWPIDRSRQFVITFFPADDTVTIFERFIPNSGIAGGCFLKRTRLRKPGADTDDQPVYYDASDFYIGAAIHASGRKFIIDDADRYVLAFMEENPDYYTKDVIEVHRKKLAEAKLAVEPLHSNRQSLQEEMRKCITERFGPEPVPIPLDLGENECQRELLENKLYAANVPIPQDLLNKALDICTGDSGNVDVGELKKIFTYSFGHKKSPSDKKC